MDMQHEQAAWRHGYGTWTGSMEMQHGHALLVCKVEMQNVDMHDGRATWKCTMGIQQHGRVAAWICNMERSMDMSIPHAHVMFMLLSTLLIHVARSSCMSILHVYSACSSVEDFF
jgi:hypothetical protein